MIQSYVRSAVICCGVIGTVLSTPSESQAIFHWFGNCCRPQTTYAPIQPAVNCNPCGAQTAQYVPTTCYRQETVAVPVTTFQPVTSCSMSACNPCNPCTWCPTTTTTMRPVTVMQQQVRMVPYTTYRIVYTTPSPCATGCGAPLATAMPAASTYYYQPSTSAVMSAPATVAPSTGSCCGGGAAPASYSAPATTYATPTSPAPVYSAPAPTLSSPPATAPNTTTPPSTYESGRPESSTTIDPNAPLSPIPQSSSSTSGATFGPSITPPDSSRTTSAPVQRAWMVRPVSNAVPADVPAWLQSQRATPTTSANTATGDDWRPSVR
ncbi:MAG: hypothetical protein KF708_03820 [Pirellulales bacterium]|nr:hypothetical protein [Pirellulales bacterium]